MMHCPARTVSGSRAPPSHYIYELRLLTARVGSSWHARCSQVDDLEDELEVADDAVVKLRREVTSGAAKLADVTIANNELQAQADALAAKLSQAEAELSAKASAIEDAERAAERAAEQLLEAQTASVEGVEATRGEATARAVKLEQELMAAESEQLRLVETKTSLEAAVEQLRLQQQAAAEERNKEAARVRELEQLASAAEAKAEAKAESLAASEASVESLQKQLEELKRALDVSGSANGAAANGASANGAAANGAAAPAANGATSPAANGAAAPTAADTPAAAAQASSRFDDEAARLTQEIEAQINAAGGTSAAAGAAAGGAAKRLALSRMKKAELVAECEERKLEASGSVAELRAALRVERKRDGLIDELVERGWSERQSRSALKVVAWDVDKALARLLKQ
jgi:hypothetical protein